jgi:hypothetical protein
MMRRRPIVVAPRRDPGILKTVARTAVVAGTATVVAKGVSNAMNAGRQQRQMVAQQQTITQEMAAQDADDAARYRELQAQAVQQAQIDAAVQQALAGQQAQAAPPPAPAAPAPAAAPGNDMMAQLEKLVQMKQAGLLTDDEYAAAKARLLAG